MPLKRVHKRKVVRKPHVRKTPRRPKRNQMVLGGSGFTDFFTKTIPGAATSIYNNVLRPGFNAVKGTHILSNVASLIPHPYAQGAATGLKVLGLGRGGQMQGRGIYSDIAGLFPHPYAQGAATGLRLLGLGRGGKKGGSMRGGANALNGRLFLV